MDVVVGARQQSIGADGWESARRGWPPRGAAWDGEPAGIVGIYAMRASDRGADLRPVINERRAAIDGIPMRSVRRGSLPWGPRRTVAVGRGTTEHRIAVDRLGPVVGAPPPVRSTSPRRGVVSGRPGVRRRLVVAGIAALVVLVGAAGTGLANEAGVGAVESPQHRYVVKPGDSLDSLADTFGVDSAAIAAASGLSASPDLAPTAVVVIPAPGETPDEAARIASLWEGTSPWVADAYFVEPGDTLADVAVTTGVDPFVLADFNGLEDIDTLDVGQRLLIPPSGSASTVDVESAGDPVIEGAAAAAIGTFVRGVPTHVQEHNLSCEYAAAFIATSAFGAGVDEWTFLQSVPQDNNPHWGYRGDIDGWWGNTDDYGVYPEALVPTLNANGFAGDVIYSGGDAAVLRDQLDAGHPVAVWLGYWGDTGFYAHTDDGTPYKLAAGYHVVVAYGYDDSGVYVSDPARGAYGWFGWDNFTSMWTVLDGMALAIYPA